MADRKIYINERVHTGQLHEAGAELIDRDLAVIGTLKERVKGIESYGNPNVEYFLIMATMSPEALPEKLRRSWSRSEIGITRLMIEAGFLSYPHKVWRNLHEKLVVSTALADIRQAEGYLNYAEARISHLQFPQVQDANGTQIWASYVYIENMALRGGLQRNVFFYPQMPHIMN